MTCGSPGTGEWGAVSGEGADVCSFRQPLLPLLPGVAFCRNSLPRACLWMRVCPCPSSPKAETSEAMTPGSCYGALGRTVLCGPSKQESYLLTHDCGLETYEAPGAAALLPESQRHNPPRTQIWEKQWLAESPASAGVFGMDGTLPKDLSYPELL